ncbi:MAG: rhamnogalacturonan lyase [Bacteroidaceae bacterium]|nr:rhamnogalacturonan lyase [Bacteroidaceae bacterium]
MMNLFTKSLLLGCMMYVPVVALADGRGKPSPADTPLSQCETLDRGFVQINTSSVSAFLSWRMLKTDDEHTAFLTLKDGKVNGDTLRNVTSKRMLVTAKNTVQLVVLQNGVPTDTISPQPFNQNGYHLLQLKRPAKGSNVDGEYDYSPNDCSVGDVDGDGEYELIVKWYPSNAKDNSQSGYTGRIYFDCYRIFTGEQLWRIDLGNNIRAGAHYNQFLVYDFDGDGRAELVCKTAPGSRDGLGEYVNQASDNPAILAASNTKDYRVSGGRVNGGQEYLTVFDGLTGKALHTIPYYPNRNAEAKLSDAAGTFNWAISGKNDTGTYGNRGERYLAAVAYLDGPDSRPSAVMCRGMYTRSYLWAVDFDGERLSTKWLHASVTATQVQVTDSEGKVTTRNYSKNTDPQRTHAVYTAYGQGAHSLTVGDVDGDGCDEIVYGNAVVNNDGHLLYSTGLGHGDALHLGDLAPDRDGLEIFMVHEESPYGCNYRDAGTGELLYYTAGSADNGRGLAADVLPGNRGYEYWSAKVDNTRNVKLGAVTEKKPSMNFRIYWDGDPYDELLDGTSITKWNANGTTTQLGIYTSNSTQKSFADLKLTPSSCNSTKATPCLQADIFGDWREEVVFWNSADPSQLYILSSTAPTNYRVPTLMHDHNYRMAIAWQNVGYNQPPHLGYYLPDYVASFQGVADDPAIVTGIASASINKEVQAREYYTLSGMRIGQPANGLFIERTCYSDGSVEVKKRMR